MAEQLVRGRISPPIADAVRLGRMTALQKGNGRVRGKWWATLGVAQQMGKVVEAATRPQRCHVYQSSNKNASPMFSKCCFPVRLFYGRPSQHLWEDSEGVVHRIAQGEGENKGNLFSLGQHAALEALKGRMVEGVLLAFLDDLYVITAPETSG